MNIYFINKIKYNVYMKKFKPQTNNLPKKEKIATTIRLESNMLDNIDKISFDYKISRNEFIVQCIKYAMDNMQ